MLREGGDGRKGDDAPPGDPSGSRRGLSESSGVPQADFDDGGDDAEVIFSIPRVEQA